METIRALVPYQAPSAKSYFRCVMQTPPGASELARWARDRFGRRLVSVRLFGSRARGEAREDSDVDVLVVVEDLSVAEGREIAHFCGDLLTRHEVLVSPLALSRRRYDELLARERRIAQEIERDGISL